MMGLFGFGRNREEEPEPDYRAIIEEAEERARRSVMAWASEQESWADEESDTESIVESDAEVMMQPDDFPMEDEPLTVQNLVNVLRGLFGR